MNTPLIEKLENLATLFDCGEVSFEAGQSAHIAKRLRATISTLQQAQEDTRRLDKLESLQNWGVESVWKEFPPPSGWRIRGETGEDGTNYFPSVRSFIDSATTPAREEGEG
jgi:hypothetical protein